MKVALTIPTAGAGKWAWQGWANAFKWFGHEVVNLSFGTKVEEIDPDLVICTTSNPRDDIVDWRKNNPKKHLALNVLAWTDRDLSCINNKGVQATAGNVEYANSLNPNLVFAQYSSAWRKRLLGKWEDAGYRLGSMEMAADATVYPTPTKDPTRELDIFYVGGRWAYKAENLDVFLLPVFKKYANSMKVVGRGWPFHCTEMTEHNVGINLRNAKVAPNIHEPHSTIGGYDVVERIFKTLYCGGLCITDYVRELEEGFGIRDAVHLFESPSPDSYLRAVTDVVEDNETFDCVREQGQKFVALNHTYFNRAATLLLDLEMIEPYEEAVLQLVSWHKEMGVA